MRKPNFIIDTFFSYDNRFAIPIVLGSILLLTAFITLLLVYKKQKNRFTCIPWYCLSIISVFLIAISIYAHLFFHEIILTVSILYITGIVSFLICVAMILIIHIAKSKKREEKSELEKMNIQDLE